MTNALDSDPWEGLTEEQAAALEYKLATDWVFYAEETPLLVADKATTQLVTFRPNFAQRHVFGILNGLAEQGRKDGTTLVRAAIPKPRQTGQTTGFCVHKYHVAATRQMREIYFLIHDLGPAAKVYKKFATMHKHQDPGFRPRLESFETGRRMTFETESTIMVESVRKQGVGRSETLHHVHATELPSWDDAETVLTGIEESVPDIAGWETSIILESTCEGVGDYWYWLVQRARKGQGQYVLIFLPWWIEPEYERPPVGNELKREPLTADEEMLARRIEVEAPMYGMPVPDRDTMIRKLLWRRFKIENRGYDKFCQEYPADVDEAFLGTGRPVFPVVSQRWHLNRTTDTLPPAAPPVGETGRVICDPKLTLEVVNKGDKLVDGRRRKLYGWRESKVGQFKLWVPPQPGGRYILPADIASGEARDRSAIHVLRSINQGRGVDQVGVWHGHVGAKELAHILVFLARKFNNGLMVPERNGPGILTLETIMDDLRYPGMQMYHHTHRDQDTGEEVVKPGFPTLVNTRSAIIEEFFAGIQTPDLVIRDAETMSEVTQFAYNKKGRPEAPEGGFDDLVLALMIGYYARLNFRTQKVRTAVAHGMSYEDNDPRSWVPAAYRGPQVPQL